MFFIRIVLDGFDQKKLYLCILIHEIFPISISIYPPSLIQYDLLESGTQYSYLHKIHTRNLKERYSFQKCIKVFTLA